MAWFTMRVVVGFSASLVLACTYDYGALEGRDGGIPITGPEDGGAAATGGRPAGTGGGTAGTTTGGSKGASGGTGGSSPATGGVATGGVVGTGGAPTGGSMSGGMGAGGGSQLGGLGPVGGMVNLGGAAGSSSRGGGAGGGASNGGATAGSDLVLRYAFDEKTGTTANDTSGFDGGPRNGTLATAGSGGSATFSTNKVVGEGALVLKGNGNTAGGYVTTIAPSTLAPQAITLAAWVNITTVGTYQRVFDFGVGTTKYLFLSPNNENNRVRFAISTNGLSGEQALVSPTGLTTQSWHHVAVVLAAGATYTGTLYIDGKAAATNTAMTLHPVDVGMTTGNYLGRSAYSADPYFNGLLDDFRIYRGALSAAEIAALAAIRD